jgi:hypothetical protein
MTLYAGDCFCELDEMPGRLFYSKRCLVFQHDEQAQVTIELKNVTKISGEVFRKEVLILYTGKHKVGCYILNEASHPLSLFAVYVRQFLGREVSNHKASDSGPVGCGTQACMLAHDYLGLPMLSAILQTETASDSSQRRLAMAEVPGLKDQIMHDIFNSQGLLPLGPEHFSEPKSDAIISVVTLSGLLCHLTWCFQTYPLALKAMFALMFGDSSAVPKEVHDLDSDVGMPVRCSVFTGSHRAQIWSRRIGSWTQRSNSTAVTSSSRKRAQW